MEIFVDGGLFEFIIAVVLGNLINFIFLKKYLLIIYSVTAVVTPILIFFFRNGGGFYFLVSFSLMNSLLLVVLLWRARQLTPHQPPLNIAKLKQRFYDKFPRLKIGKRTLP